MSTPNFTKSNKNIAFYANQIYNRAERGDYMTTGDKIKQRRLELGWSLRELAKRMGYANQSTVSRIEKGEIDVPQSKVVKFAEVMGTTVAFLMDWEETQKKNDIAVDIILKLQDDEEFLSIVEMLYKLDPQKQLGIKQLLISLSK